MAFVRKGQLSEVEGVHILQEPRGDYMPCVAFPTPADGVRPAFVQAIIGGLGPLTRPHVFGFRSQASRRASPILGGVIFPTDAFRKKPPQLSVATRV